MGVFIRTDDQQIINDCNSTYPSKKYNFDYFRNNYIKFQVKKELYFVSN